MTGIEWTDETWNPTTGCDRVGPGCANCYAADFAARLNAMGHPKYQNDGDPRTSGPGFAVTVHPDTLEVPLRWRKPRRVFVDSMSDLFHPAVPTEFIGRVWHTMALANRHTFQILTKRPARMAQVVADIVAEAVARHTPACQATTHPCRVPNGLRNVWLGTSIETDRYVWRADHLRNTPAAVRFLSLEPLLGPLPSLDLGGIDWVIVGGESGRRARPMHPGWVQDIRDRCGAAGVAFFFKQWGEWAPAGSMYDTSDRTHLVLPDGTDRGTPWGGWALDRPEAEPMRRFGKRAAGRDLDGRTWDQYPEAVG